MIPCSTSRAPAEPIRGVRHTEGRSLLAARAKQADLLGRAGLSADAVARILAPLDAELSKYRFAPILVLAPETEMAETLEFDPARIRAGIEAGRRAVALNWAKLEALVAG